MCRIYARVCVVVVAKGGYTSYVYYNLFFLCTVVRLPRDSVLTNKNNNETKKSLLFFVSENPTVACEEAILNPR